MRHVVPVLSKGYLILKFIEMHGFHFLSSRELLGKNIHVISPRHFLKKQGLFDKQVTDGNIPAKSS